MVESTAKNVAERVTGIIAEQAGVGCETLAPETRLVADLGLDSLDLMEIVMEVEEEFEVPVQDEDVKELESVGKVIEYVRERVNKG